MKKLLIVGLSTFIALAACAQTAWEEIHANPDLAAGKYLAYQAPDDKLVLPPAGYEPFYISMFARHGSRYLTDAEKYTEPIAVLDAADRAGVLTTDGQRALTIIKKMAREAEGRYGELTPKGAQQHRELVSRMYARCPEVFVDGVHVDARSTTKTRAFLSMASACVELARLNPGLVITQDASMHDAVYLKYKNKDYENLHLRDMDNVYRKADSAYVHPEALMKRLFVDSGYVTAHVRSPQALMMSLFELHGISQSSMDMPDLGFLFTERECYDLWQRNNFEWYYEKGPSPLSDTCMYRLGRNLLENFVLTADTVIRSGRRCVTLRYGHDTNLAPLVVLMGCDRLTEPTVDWQDIAETFRTYRIIPMCGNVQLVFYRNPAGGDILVRVLLNEREVTLPIATDAKPFYRWNDLRKYWMSVVDSIEF